MLNQCIFIGRIQESETLHNGKMQLVLNIDGLHQGQSPTVIKFILPEGIPLSGVDLNKGMLVAVKSRVENDEEKNVNFVIERMTWLGGTKRES